MAMAAAAPGASTCTGATYTPFPDPRSHRIALAELRKQEIRERLHKVWLEPLSLDPSRESARVTREIAARLATLARSLEQAGHAPEIVAQFLMRCLFTGSAGRPQSANFCSS